MKTIVLFLLLKATHVHFVCHVSSFLVLSHLHLFCLSNVYMLNVFGNVLNVILEH